MDPELYAVFRYYLNEREAIRLRRESGMLGPWTKDPIFLKFKFTNVMRSNDWTTRWAVKNWYGPNRHQPLEVQALNCAIFRYFGSAEFAEAVGYQTEWNPSHLIQTARHRLAKREKVFTGAYIVTNGGRTDPKQEVVVNHYLAPFRQNVDKIVRVAERDSWQQVAQFLQTLPGIGPFMSKEIALDMLLTPLLENATDKLTWSPVGPGAIRGLNRLNRRPLEKPATQAAALEEMKDLMAMVAAEPIINAPTLPVDVRDPSIPGMIPEFPRVGVEFGVTDVQFSLCEVDKYLRVRNGEGKPRSGYDFKKARLAP
jgi:hypothetical protein